MLTIKYQVGPTWYIVLPLYVFVVVYSLYCTIIVATHYFGSHMIECNYAGCFTLALLSMFMILNLDILLFDAEREGSIGSSLQTRFAKCPLCWLSPRYATMEHLLYTRWIHGMYSKRLLSGNSNFIYCLSEKYPVLFLNYKF